MIFLQLHLNRIKITEKGACIPLLFTLDFDCTYAVVLGRGGLPKSEKRDFKVERKNDEEFAMSIEWR
jgi:hypothetical protein